MDELGENIPLTREPVYEVMPMGTSPVGKLESDRPFEQPVTATREPHSSHATTAELPLDDIGAHGSPRPQDRPAHGGTGIIDGRLQVGKDVDRKSTRLNSSHPSISYAVFCLKKKKKPKQMKRI